jgi:hypothetical protein
MNFWNQLVGSVMKPDYYLSLIKRSTGKAVTYLILLTLITSILYGIRVSLMWNGMVDTQGKEFENKSPDFIFANGEIMVKATMPYVISKTNKTLFIVDTSGKSDEGVLKGYDKGVFIGKSKIVNKKSSLETSSYDLSTIKNFTFTKADVVKAMPWIKWANILIVLFMFIFGIIANLGAALLVGICGWIASKIMSCQIVFDDLYKIGIYALTMPLFLEMVKNIAGVNVPLFRVAFYIISIGYTVKVLMTVKNKSNIEVDEAKQ